MKKKLVIFAALAAVVCAALVCRTVLVSAQRPMELKIEDGVPYGRSSADTDWVRLGEAISPPAEWAKDDLAGRNTATTLIGEPEIVAQMVDRVHGWIVVTYGRGVAAADTYVYRSSDKGKTWQQCAAPPLTWLVSEVGAISEDRLLIGGRLFDEAPVFLTTDGGATWQEIQTPDPDAELQSVEIGNGTVTLTLALGTAETWTMVSGDLGDTWEVIRAAQQ